MDLDVIVYCTGCVNCHKVVSRLRQLGNINIETNEKIVMEVASKSFGVVPIFEHRGKLYNEYQISNMIDNKFDFTIKDNIAEEPKVVKNIKIKQEE